jgi:hypothetical protein
MVEYYRRSLTKYSLSFFKTSTVQCSGRCLSSMVVSKGPVPVLGGLITGAKRCNLGPWFPVFWQGVRAHHLRPLLQGAAP